MTFYSSTNCSLSSDPTSRTFEDVYELGEILGEGTSSVVKKCYLMNDPDRKPMAVKIMRTDDEEKMNAAKSEFNLMKKLNHENIVEVKEIFVENFKHRIYTLMEYIDGKELFDTIVEEGAFTEHKGRYIFK